MPKILITGFEPFREVTTNPSQLIVEHLAKQNNTDLITEVLPVVYRKAEERIKALLHEHQPDAVMMLGVAQKREEINLERIAVNLDDATIPDNIGKHLTGKPIFENAPVGYWSTLPLKAMHTAITKAEIPVTYSNHAGAFLCNHVFYIARHTLETTNRRSVPCGFIHLPSVETLPIEIQIQAIELCLQQFQNPTGFANLLKHLASNLPDTPRYTQLQDVSGVPIANWGSGIDQDRMVAMTAACNALSERITKETGCGDFRYTVIIGTQGTFVGVRLNENQDMLSMCFNNVKSLDNLIRKLSTSLNELNSTLCCTGYNIVAELEPDVDTISNSYLLAMRHVPLEQLLIPPREVSVISVDGLPLAGVPKDKMREKILNEEADRVTPMSAAGVSFGERISSEMGNGLMQELIIYGTKGTFIITFVGEKAVLVAIYDRVLSLDRILSQLRDVANTTASWV